MPSVAPVFYQLHMNLGICCNFFQPKKKKVKTEKRKKESAESSKAAASGGGDGDADGKFDVRI